MSRPPKNTVKLPNGKHVKIRHVSEFKFGELEDLEEIQEELTEVGTAFKTTPIKKFLALIAPEVDDKTRRSMTLDEIGEFITSAWEKAQTPLDPDSQGESNEGKA